MMKFYGLSCFCFQVLAAVEKLRWGCHYVLYLFKAFEFSKFQLFPLPPSHLPLLPLLPTDFSSLPNQPAFLLGSGRPHPPVGTTVHG